MTQPRSYDATGVDGTHDSPLRARHLPRTATLTYRRAMRNTGGIAPASSRSSGRSPFSSCWPTTARSGDLAVPPRPGAQSTASRLVATLEQRGLVEQVEDRGKYRLGAGVLRLAGATNARLDLVQEARPLRGASPRRRTRRSISSSAPEMPRSTSTRSAARRRCRRLQLGRAAHPTARDVQRQGARQRAAEPG